MLTVLEQSFRPPVDSILFHPLPCLLSVGLGVLGETSALTWPNENIGNNMLPLRVPLIMYLRLDTRRPL